MANTITGQIASIGQTQSLTTKSGNAFQKRDIVIIVRRFDPNTGEPMTDYENTPQLSFYGDKCRDLDRFQVGQMVTIYFDLRGSKYVNTEGRESIITEARPYRIELYGQQRQAQSQQAQAHPQTIPSASSTSANPAVAPQAHPAPQSNSAPQPAAQPQYPYPQSFQDPFQ